MINELLAMARELGTGDDELLPVCFDLDVAAVSDVWCLIEDHETSIHVAVVVLCSILGQGT